MNLSSETHLGRVSKTSVFFLALKKNAHLKIVRYFPILHVKQKNSVREKFWNLTKMRAWKTFFCPFKLKKNHACEDKNSPREKNPKTQACKGKKCMWKNCSSITLITVTIHNYRCVFGHQRCTSFQILRFWYPQPSHPSNLLISLTATYF